MCKEQHKDNASNTYVLKVIMHCQCNGCIKKINDGVKEITLSEGVERAGLVVETAEVIVVGQMDPETLCCLLHERTQKHVKIETQTTVFEEDAAAEQQTKNRASQALENPGRRQPITPSALLLPEAWRTPVALPKRCAYRGSSPSPGAWAASDIAGTLAAYELGRLSHQMLLCILTS